MIDDQKFCKKCQMFKSLASFVKDTSRVDGKYPWCRACRSKYVKNFTKKTYASTDPSRLCLVCDQAIGGAHPNVRYCSSPCRNRANLARGYGLTIQEYQQILLATGGRCPICQNKPKRWCMDHNHETGEVYGPCCDNCNTKLIAWTLHDPAVALRLQEFLTNPPVRALLGERFVSAKLKGEKLPEEPKRYPNGLTRRGRFAKGKVGTKARRRSPV